MDQRLTSTWWMLRIALGLAPLLAGLDKFFNLLTSWTDYLNPMILERVPLDADVLMRGIGVIEILVGVAILTRWTKWGAYVAAVWLAAFAVNLFTMGRFYDVAVLDLVLAVSALALARITAVREEARVRVAVADTAWEPAPKGGILSLNL